MDIAQTTPLAALEALADEELRAVIAQATQLLAAREIERRKQALAQIRQIAKESGLTVSVKEPARKRGRPRKDGNQS
jgi:hypothetical protein